MPPLSRRDFLAASGSAVALSVLPFPAAHQERTGVAPDAQPLTILFQGDSITDGGRDRKVVGPNVTAGLGSFYPLYIAGAMLAAHPERQLRFINRGVSGNTVPDLRARWETDTLAIKPDVLSILIGVNDLWHKLDGTFSGTVSDYERDFSALLASTRAALPHVTLIVLEPFVLRTGHVNARWFPEFDERRAVAARVAHGAKARFIALQRMFDELSKHADPAYWAADGVHPTAAGNSAIAQHWMKEGGALDSSG
ncbi:MAG: GDSL-type esterase/lipase family protein [Gemmatimonadaceae bacterium]